MMTRKDYVALAAAIERSDTVYDAALSIIDVLAADNPRFDRERFMKACGFTGALR